MKDTLVTLRFNQQAIKLPSDCWEWSGYRCPQGYGKFSVMGETLAHRVSFKLHGGNIPENMCVLHKCDNPSCVNPDHLFLGTWDDNNKDRANKKRTVTPNMNLTHCKRGHEFTEENTVIRKNGTRVCRNCRNATALKAYHSRHREGILKRYKEKRA